MSRSPPGTGPALRAPASTETVSVSPALPTNRSPLPCQTAQAGLETMLLKWLPMPNNLATSRSVYPLIAARLSMSRIMCRRKQSIRYFISAFGGRDVEYASASCR